MDARERLRHWIDAEQGRLAIGLPPDRETALLALLAAIDRLPLDAEREDRPDLITGRPRPGLGLPLALRICLEASPDGDGSADAPAGWATSFLERCRAIEAAALVLRFAESGAMRLVATGEARIDAILARVPALWLERSGIDAWAAKLAAAVPLAGDAAAATVRRMAYQLPYPDAGDLGGVRVGDHRAVLAALIAPVLAGARNAGPRVVEREALAASVAVATDLAPETVAKAIDALTLDVAGAGWHAALPGGPQAPMVRLAGDRLAISRRGLLSEPGFFLARELRRRDPVGYHNDAHAREAAFRDDLYALFVDRRYAHSESRIMLRTADRRNRTDIDAAIFDRKTGTLAVFELKSQDPLARSAEELARQRENLRRAGQQVGTALDWLNRNGADNLLTRIDPATARRFRVQRVLPFVLGRYSADPGAGGDRRAAWGAWPQVLAAMDANSGGNPLLSLHGRLLRGEAPPAVPDSLPPAEIGLAGGMLIVHPAWSVYRAIAAEDRH